MVTRLLRISLIVTTVSLSAIFGTAAAETVSGVVKYEGPEFKLRAIRMNADPKCEELHAGERVDAQDRLVAADSKGVANTFVYLEKAPAGSETPVPSEPVTLGQEGCMYSPRVLGIRVGQPLSVSNDDPTLHNVRCLARSNRPFNLGQPPGRPAREKVFTTPEIAMKFKCDVHPWMSAYVFAMEHDFFAVTDATGKFQIKGLPAGKYTLKAWHEIFGEQEVEVEVKAGGTDGVTFSYKE